MEPRALEVSSEIKLKCFVQLEISSSFLQIKWIKPALAHSYELHIRANFYSTSGGDMESICTELALYGSKNECARTDNVYFSISEVGDGRVSLV